MRMPESIPWRSTGKTLGRGRQGEVHIVTHKDRVEGPEYALKVLSNTGSPQARQRFRREIEVIKQLQSPAIVQIFDHS